LTALISRRVSGREQGKVMGGQQAILSLTLIFGPVIAGLAFDHLGVPAPYWIGSLLAALALLVAAATLLPEQHTSTIESNTAKQVFCRQDTVRKPREPGA
jgi:MFS family permease